MSFNIRYGTADDTKNHWDKRKQFAISRIHAFDPDLLGLQECRDDSQAAYVKAQLTDHQFYGVRREGGGDAALEMAATLHRKDSFQTLEQGTFWLSDTPQVVGSKSWGSAFARTVTWLKLLHLPSARELMFVNTHFDYQTNAVNGAARVLRKWLEQQELAVIVTGDFNADKNSWAYQHLLGNEKLSDAYRELNPHLDETTFHGLDETTFHGLDETTFHGFGKPQELAAIDWILISHHFRVVTAEIDRSCKANLFASDHYPIMAVLDWNDTDFV